jgi:hypothetical protein
MGALLLNLVKWLAGLAVPALLAMFVPRRWLVVTLVTWALLPALVVLVLFLGEVVRTPSELAAPDQILRALLFYGGFLLLPWFVMSVAGYAAGLALRRRRARPATSPTTPPQAPTWQVSRPPPGPEWRARHIGFELDGLILDGLDVWGSQWRRLGTDSVELPHPAHPKQRHRFRIYEAGHGSQARQFAATELSNGVWGFYTQGGGEERYAGTSADGSVRRRIGRNQWLVALAILAGALIAIGGISVVVDQLMPGPTQTLSTVPDMPH